MITHRLRGVVQEADPRLPALTGLAAHLLAAVDAAWGEHPLALAPAFRRG